MAHTDYLCIAAAILTGIALTGSACAQSSEPACSVGINHFVGYGGMRENSLPFTATAKTTYEQSLPDGNEIRGYIYTHQARDSAGRTRSEMGQGC
jgi:hypothetical protein